MRHRSNHTVSRKSIHGFTLTELLVVISIIALLLSILMPSLRKVREQAKLVVCMFNTKSLTYAAMMYVLDNEDCLPMSGSRNSAGNLFSQYPYAPYWDMRLLPYLDIDVSMTYAPEGETHPANTELLPHRKALEVFICPGVRATSTQTFNYLDSIDQLPKCYTINGHVSGIIADADGNRDVNASYRRGSSRISRVEQSSMTLLLSDKKLIGSSAINYLDNWLARFWWDIQPAHMVKGVGPPDGDYANRWNPWFFQETYGRNCFGFVDGHAANYKTQFTPAGDIGDTGVSSPDAVQGIKFSAAYGW